MVEHNLGKIGVAISIIAWGSEFGLVSVLASNQVNRNWTMWVRLPPRLPTKVCMAELSPEQKYLLILRTQRKNYLLKYGKEPDGYQEKEKRALALIEAAQTKKIESGG